MMRGEMTHRIEVGGLAARENVVFGDGLEIFRGEGQIHRVPRLARKINREAREHRVHRLDAAKAPAPVRAAAAIGELREEFNVATFNFSGGGEFFKFCSHLIIIKS